MPNKRDLMLALGFAVLGGIFGALILFQTGALYFYQSYMPELIYSACGRGFVHPTVVPKAVMDFLLLRAATFDCVLLDASVALQPRGIFAQTHLYLALAVSAVWRLSSIDYRNLWPLISLLTGAYACGCFVLLRLFFGRLAAAAGALVLTLSPVMLSMIVYLRDYAKAPFLVWGVVLLLLARRARTSRATLLWVMAAGAIVGTGYGFRSDVIILLPIGFLFLAFGLGPRAWRLRAGALAAFAAATLLLASPMFIPGNGGGFGTVLMQGMSEPFRAYLDLGVAPYTLGQRYSDELVLSSVAAELRPTDPGWDAREGAAFQTVTQSVTRSGPYVVGWLVAFSGDMATQALKSAVWIVGFPALVAPGRIGLDPGGPVRAGPQAAQYLSWLYDRLASPWLPAICTLGLIAFFWRVTSVNPREASALAVMFAALLCYPVVQFSIRHVFHLEFIWVAALLALLHLPFERAALRRVSSRFAVLVVISGLVILGIRYGLIAHQERSLIGLFNALLGQPRELVTALPPRMEDSGKAVFSVPLPDKYRTLVESRADSMTTRMGEFGMQAEVRAAADRLLITVGGPGCPAGKLNLSFHYAKRDDVWQPFDHDITVEGHDQRSTTTVLVPAFYRPSQYLADIEVPSSHAACIAKIEQLAGPTRLPVILTAVLAPGWQERPLHRSFGGFPMSAERAR
jgi:4-amino-4-deoxy-L-arabinose transferase-like glycosyltransferase